MQTTVPSQQEMLDQQALQAWAAETKWCGLEAVAHLANVSKQHSKVEFNAFFQTETGRGKTSRNFTFCANGGSGKKFKHCCGI